MGGISLTQHGQKGRESSLCKCSILIIFGGRPYSLPNKNGPGLTPGYKHRKDSKVVIANRQKKSSRDAMTSSKVELPGEVKNDPAALMASLHLVPSPVPNPEIKYTKVRETVLQLLVRILKLP